MNMKGIGVELLKNCNVDINHQVLQGRDKVKEVTLPESESSRSSPPWAWAISRARLKPKPDPGTVLLRD